MSHEATRVVLWVVLAIWGIGGAAGLVLIGLDWLAGALHRRRSSRRSLWF